MNFCPRRYLRSLPAHQIVLGLILLLGLGLRLWGLDFGLPNLSRPDEQNVADAIFRILGSFYAGEPSLNPHFFHYSSLYIYFLSLFYGAYFLLGYLLGTFPHFGAFHQLYLDDWSSFFLIARAVTAMLGTVTIWFMYRLGREVGGSRAPGIIAAFLLSVTYLHVRDSHFGVTDVPAMVLTTACLWRTALFYRSRAKKHLFQAAFLAGIAASVKYPAGLAALPVLLAFRLDLKDRHHDLKDLIQSPPLIRQGLIVAGLIGGGFLLFSPYILLDYPQFLDHYLWQSNVMFKQTFVDLGRGWFRHLSFSLWHGLGGLYLLAGLGGMFWAYRIEPDRKRLHGLLITYALVFYLIIGNSHVVFVRYIIPILPVLTLYAAWSTARISQALKPRLPATLPPPVITGILAGVIGLSSIQHSLQFNALAARTDTRTQAVDWLLPRLNPHEAIGHGLFLNQIELPRRYRKYQLQTHASGTQYTPHPVAQFSPTPHTPRNEYRISTYTDVSRLRALGIRYVVLPHSPMDLYTVPAPEIQALENNPEVRLAARFSPYPKDQQPAGKEAYDQIDAFFIPFTNMAGMQRPGPDIRIYEVLPEPQAE